MSNDNNDFEQMHAEVIARLDGLQAEMELRLADLRELIGSSRHGLAAVLEQHRELITQHLQDHAGGAA